MNKEDITKRIRLIHDTDYQWDDGCGINIAYMKRSRECLGTEAVTEERMNEIRDGIADDTLLGLAVFAYVHSGATIATSPFSCPWDSGRSGFVYMSAEDAKGWPDKDSALKALDGYVKAFDTYMQGDVYGYVIEEKIEHVWTCDDTGEKETRVTWEEHDSCWGFLGHDPKENGIEDYVSEYLKQGYVYTDEEGEPI